MKPSFLRRLFLTPESVSAWSLDEVTQSEAHRQAHLNNRLLKEWFAQTYERHIRYFSTSSPTVELGSGGSQFKKYWPKLVTTDVLPLKDVDKVMDAQKMDFENASVGNLTLINVLHHIPKPLEFFKEADRVLKKSGRLVLTEPFISPFSFILYKFFHHEPCELNKFILELPSQSSGLSNSNQAIPTRLLSHYTKELREAAPNLKIVEIEYHSWFSYFLTGGVNHKPRLPLILWKVLNYTDRIFCFLFGRFLASFFTVVFEKR